VERPALTPRFFRKGALNLALGGLLMLFCGLVYRFYLDGSGMLSVLFFSAAALCFALALAEFVLARLVRRSAENAKPS
jgi:hypothetical protein